MSIGVVALTGAQAEPKRAPRERSARRVHHGVCLTDYSSEIMPLFLYNRCFISFSSVRVANEGSSGIPSPRRTGTIATSTVSTRRAARRLRKIEPPRKAKYLFRVWHGELPRLLGLVAKDRHVRMFSWFERARKNECLHAGHGSLSHFFHGCESSASHEHGIEPFKKLSEIHLEINDDPIGFALGTGNVTVQACRYCVTNLLHSLCRGGRPSPCLTARLNT
jgi:hypothetical protein